jgi:hypothetical protein
MSCTSIQATFYTTPSEKKNSQQADKSGYQIFFSRSIRTEGDRSHVDEKQHLDMILAM